MGGPPSSRGGDETAPAEEWIFGVHGVLEALRSGRRNLDRIWMTEGRDRDGGALREILFRARQSSIPVLRVPRERLDRVAGKIRHQGVGALATPVPYEDLDALLDAKRNDDWPRLLLVLDEVTDPYNFASLIRSAEVCGATGIVIPERRSASVGAIASKLGAGAGEHLPVARVGNLAAALERIKLGGIQVVGAVPHGGKDPARIDLAGELALVVGNEARGLRRIVREKCDCLASIPQRGAIGSLSVSVAGAILLYEVGRQRTGGTGKQGK